MGLTISLNLSISFGLTARLLSFYRYELVRRSGKYSMIMETRLAMIEAGLKTKDYSDVIRHYSEYKSAIEAKCQTTFWSDFTIAEKFGVEAIKDTHKRAKDE